MGHNGVLKLHFPRQAGSKTPSRRKNGTHDCSLRPKAAGAIQPSVVLLSYLRSNCALPASGVVEDPSKLKNGLPRRRRRDHYVGVTTT